MRSIVTQGQTVTLYEMLLTAAIAWSYIQTFAVLYRPWCPNTRGNVTAWFQRLL